MIKVHHLRPAAGSKQDKKRVGRGDKTAGRGMKGTKARNKVRQGFEGGQMPIHMRLPKLRGFKNVFKVTYQVVNLDKLSESFPKGGKITSAMLAEKGIVRDNAPVKVLGNGEVTAKFELVVDACSGSAKEKIEKAGGSVSLIEE